MQLINENNHNDNNNSDNNAALKVMQQKNKIKSKYADGVIDVVAEDSTKRRRDSFRTEKGLKVITLFLVPLAFPLDKRFHGLRGEGVSSAKTHFLLPHRAFILPDGVLSPLLQLMNPS